MHRKHPFISVILILLLTACEHEISYDYPTLDEPLVNIEGRITNEGAYVRISKTQPVTTPSQYQAIGNADVWIESDNGITEQLHFVDSCGMYLPEKELIGKVGHSYTLHVVIDGHTFEGTSTMPPPAPITETKFRWLDIQYERILHYDLTAIDPQPETLNYYWYRMLRGNQVYRWNAIDDRGCPAGFFVRDIICMSEGMKKDQDYEDRVLVDGDTINLELLTIDKPTYDYLQSLIMSRQTSANPTTNLKGSCTGFFTAASITHSDQEVFRYEQITE